MQTFQMDEIYTAIFQISDNSTWGPNGLNSKNFKIHWEQFKDDIYNAMNGILQHGKIIK